MNPKIKLIGGIATAVIIASGISLLAKKKPSSSQPPQEKQFSSDLPIGRESDKAQIDCLPERGKFKEEIVRIKDYSLVAFERDFNKSQKPVSQSLPKGVTVLSPKDGEDMHDHSDHEGQDYATPNSGIAVMKVDPFEGCVAVVRDLASEPLPTEMPEKLRTYIQKVRWTYMAKELANEELSLQDWVLKRTGNIGPNQLTLSDDDVKALLSMGVELQEWHKPGISNVEKYKLIGDHANKVEKEKTKKDDDHSDHGH